MLQNKTIQANDIYAQGDVLFIRIGDLPEGIEPQESKLKVAEGELHNHNHYVDGPVAVLETDPRTGRKQSTDAFIKGEATELVVAFFGETRIKHIVGHDIGNDGAWTGDHYDGSLAEPGMYAVVRQRTLSILEGMMRRVAD